MSPVLNKSSGKPTRGTTSLESIGVLHVRDIITNDPVALPKWNTVNDVLVAEDNSERLAIANLLTSQRYEEAVLRSLQFWISYNSTAATVEAFVPILRHHKLNSAAAKLESLCHGSGETNDDGIAKGMWLGVSDVVHNFTGRSEELTKLHKIIQDSHANQSSSLALITGLTGLGGIGKTSLARKYAHVHYLEYDGNVLWISAASPSSMRNSFKDAADRLGLLVADNSPDETLAQLVYNYFSHSKVLFIFDNAESFGDLQAFRPKNMEPSISKPFVLVTSRLRNFIPNSKQILQLDVLSLEDAVSFILNEVEESTEQDAILLAQELQMLPLALQQAVAYIREVFVEGDNSIRRYLRELKGPNGANMLARRGEHFVELTGYEATTLSTWMLTLHKIRQDQENGAGAVNLIRLMSFLNPDGISLEMLCKLSQAEVGLVEWEDLCLADSPNEDTKQTEACLKLLQKFSMISVEKSVTRIHRLVQHVIRVCLANDKEEEKRLVNNICLVLQYTLKDHAFTKLTRECTSHGTQLAQYLEKTELLVPYSDTINDLCWFLFYYGSYANAFAIAQQHENLLVKLLGEDDEKVLTARFRLAESLHNLGKNDESLTLLEKIIESGECSLGKLHGLVFEMYRLQTRVHSSLGDHQRAVDICDYIIPLQASLVEPNHLTILKSKFSKAIALYRLGRYSDCQDLFQEVHEGRCEKLGPKNPLTLNTRRWVANVTYKKGDLVAALAIYKEVLEERVKILGPTHPDTILCQGNVDEVEGKLRAAAAAVPIQLQSAMQDIENC